MDEKKETKTEINIDQQGRLEALVSQTTIEDVERIKRRANLIVQAQIGEMQTKPLTEGDVWACITAIREIAYTG